MTKTDDIASALSFDALHTAEQLTGRSYKDSKATEALGLALHIEHVQRKADLLRAAGDTVFSNTVADYLRIAAEEGFAVVLDLPFKGRVYGEEEAADEHLYVLWHADGVLLKFDTHGGDSVNGGQFYYNWRPRNNAPEEGNDCLSSGGWERMADDWIWSGNHDCREALRYHLRQLRERGGFVKPWVRRPFLWLLHYMDEKTEGFDYKAVNRERLLMLPAEVRAVIEPAETARAQDLTADSGP